MNIDPLLLLSLSIHNYMWLYFCYSSLIKRFFIICYCFFFFFYWCCPFFFFYHHLLIMAL